MTTKTKRAITMFRNILQEIDISDLVVNGNLKESFIDALHTNIDNIEASYDKEVQEVEVSDILEEAGYSYS